MRRAPASRIQKIVMTTMSASPESGPATAIAGTRERITAPRFRRSRRMRSSNTSRHSEAAVALRRHWKRWTVTVLVLVVLVAAAVGALAWSEFFKSEKQQLSDDPVARFAYGSLDGELLAGIPYPIFMILPRVFPDLLAKYSTDGYGPEKPGYGGY